MKTTHIQIQTLTTLFLEDLLVFQLVFEIVQSHLIGQPIQVLLHSTAKRFVQFDASLKVRPRLIRIPGTPMRFRPTIQCLDVVRLVFEHFGAVLDYSIVITG